MAKSKKSKKRSGGRHQTRALRVVLDSPRRLTSVVNMDSILARSRRNKKRVRIPSVSFRRIKNKLVRQKVKVVKARKERGTVIINSRGVSAKAAPVIDALDTREIRRPRRKHKRPPPETNRKRKSEQKVGDK